jgi:hypothetical protein
MTPTYADLANSPWLHGADFRGQDVTLRITRVEMHEFEGLKGDVELRGTLAFKGTDKKLGLNFTNREALRHLFGPKDAADFATVDLNDLWAGHKVTFYPSPERNPATKQIEPAVRVKGSPELTAPVTFELRMPRKRPVTVTLEPTSQHTAKTAPGEANAAPRPTDTPTAPNAPETASAAQEGVLP